MSDVCEESKRFARSAASLLKEYGKKLDQIQAEANSLLKELDHDFDPRYTKKDEFVQERLTLLFHSRFMGLQRALLQFARATSQRLEHSDLEDIARIELKVRLADLEANLMHTQQFLELACSFER